MVDRIIAPLHFASIDGDFVKIGRYENLSGINIIESPDNPGDNLNILGDVQNDRFTLTTSGIGRFVTQYPMVYIGAAGGGIIAGVAGPTDARPIFDVGGFSAPEYYDNYTPVRFIALGIRANDAVFPLSRGGTFDLSPLCLAEGSRIRTSRGDVAVEKLRVGDRAVTASGQGRRVVWTGSRTLESRDGHLPFEAWPVRILKDAFGPGLPQADLRLSPGHPVLVGQDDHGEGGVLVPVMCLVNGTSIERVPVATITYWHVELEEHDILVADGLAVESYIDLGSRGWFEAGSTSPLEHPDFVPAGRNGRCRPVMTEGPMVEAERAHLSALFALSLGNACAWDETARFAWVAT